MSAKKKTEQKKPTPTMTPLQATVELARRGEKKILPRLRQILDEHPELIGHYDDLAKRAQHAWLDLFGENLFAKETAVRQLEAMRQELAESEASPLEKLVIERLIACWLQSLYFDAREAVGMAHETEKLAEFRLKRQAQANKQFFAAVKSLSELRKATPPSVVINITAEQNSAAASSNGKTNGSSVGCPGVPSKPEPHQPTRTNGHHHNRIAALMGVG